MSGSFGKAFDTAYRLGSQPASVAPVYSDPVAIPPTSYAPQMESLTPMAMLQAYRSGASWGDLDAMNPRMALPVAPTPLPASLFEVPVNTPKTVAHPEPAGASYGDYSGGQGGDESVGSDGGDGGGSK